MNNTTSLSRVDGATTLYDNTYLSSLLTRLQAQNQKSRLGSDSVAYVQAYPCLLLIDTANAVLLKLYQTYTPSYSATDPFNLVWQLNSSSYSTAQAMIASGMPATASPANLAALHMALFTGNVINYITGSQMVVSSGMFANSPAMIKSIAIGSDKLSLSDANGVLTLDVNASSVSSVLSCTAPLIKTGNVLSIDLSTYISATAPVYWTAASPGWNISVDSSGLFSWNAPLSLGFVPVNGLLPVSPNYGAGLKLSGNQLVVDTSAIEPYFAPVMPLSLSGSGTSTQLKLNYAFGLNLDSNNKLQIDTSVLGLNSSDRGTTWKIGLPNLPTIPGILIIPGSGGGSTTAAIDYSKIQEPIQVVLQKSSAGWSLTGF